MNSGFLSVAECARQRGRTLQTIYRGLWEGRIPGAVRVDGKWRIPVPEKAPAGTKLGQLLGPEPAPNAVLST